MADPNPLAGMPLAESLANQMNESLQWMARMWGNSAALPMAGAESMFGGQSPLGRPGQPAELAGLFVQLADPLTSYTTGNVFGAGGGQGQP